MERKLIMKRKALTREPVIVEGIDVSNRKKIYTREELDKLEACGYFLCHIEDEFEIGNLDEPQYENIVPYGPFVIGRGKDLFFFFQPGNKIELVPFPENEVDAEVRRRYELIGVKCPMGHFRGNNTYRYILKREGHPDEDISGFFPFRYKGGKNPFKDYEVPPYLARDAWGRIFRIQSGTGKLPTYGGFSLEHDGRDFEPDTLVCTDVTPQWMAEGRYRKAVCDFDMSMCHFCGREDQIGNENNHTRYYMDPITFLSYFEDEGVARELYHVRDSDIRDELERRKHGFYDGREPGEGLPISMRMDTREYQAH